jgi:hypothetical protein
MLAPPGARDADVNLRFRSKVLTVMSGLLFVLPLNVRAQTASQIQTLATPGNAERAATAAAIRAVASARAKANAAAKDATGGLLDINTVSRARLMTLPGIGQMLSQRIVRGRPYAAKTELARIIGNTTYTRIQALITVSKIVAAPAPARPASPPAAAAAIPAPAKTRPIPIK